MPGGGIMQLVDYSLSNSSLGYSSLNSNIESYSSSSLSFSSFIPSSSSLSYSSFSSSLNSDKKVIEEKFNEEMYKFKSICNIEIDNCSICINEMILNENIYETECKHRYHKNCLEQYIKHNSKNKITCPLCRHSLK